MRLLRRLISTQCLEHTKTDRRDLARVVGANVFAVNRASGEHQDFLERRCKFKRNSFRDDEFPQHRARGPRTIRSRPAALRERGIASKRFVARA